MALGQVYRLIFQYRVQDKLCSWGSHYECIAGTDPLDDASDLLDGFQTNVSSEAMAALASDVTLEGLYASAITPGLAMPARVNARSTVGDDSGDSTPANMCAVFTLQTDNVAAIRQGRIFFSGISRDRLSSGLWSAAFLAGELSALGTKLGLTFSVGAKQFRPILLQTIVGGVEIEPNIFPIVAVRVTQIPYTQRRRTTKQFGSFGA